MIIVDKKNNYKEVMEAYQKATADFIKEMMKRLTPAIKKATENLKNLSKGKKIVDIEDLELIEEEDNGET